MFLKYFSDIFLQSKK